MLAPLRWIKDYVDIKDDVKSLADKMVMTGNAVEEIITIGDNCKNVVVGKILKLEKHPDADKLQICQIDVGESEPVQIVTGADNVFEGAYVPAALVGADLPCGMHIKKGKLRGVPSNGMLCSGEELCITEEEFEGAGVHGIFILKGEPKPGTDIKEYLGLGGSVINFEIGSNRPDCLSIMGIAREAAAAVGEEFKSPCTDYSEGDVKTSDLVSVEIKDTDLCSRYLAGGVVNVKIGPSPDWMKKRLAEAGIRSINNIVDITNFVMIETGQPMHAFDAQDIRGNGIVVRRAQNGEKLVTLDEKERQLTDSMLLICDKEGAIGLAGIMGGLNSEIKETTKTVIFESAKFMYGNIRQTSRALGMSTEASMRFSKGVDAGTSEFALKRALHLVQEQGAGEITNGIIDVCSEDLSPRTVVTTGAKVNALLGTSLTAEQMSKYLNLVSIKTTLEGDTLTCAIPCYRGDIEGGADIAEEVARMYGYDNIDATVMKGEITKGGVSQNEAVSDKIKNYLCMAGFAECVTYSFAGEQDYKKLGIPMPNSIKIRNPLGDDKGYMRTTMAADMLYVVANNLAKKNDNFKLFETGRIYIPKENPTEEIADEYPVLAMALCGEKEDFFTLKGYVENIISIICKKGIKCRRADKAYLHPGRSAKIILDGNEIGEMGEVHVDTAQRFDIDKKVYFAQIRMDLLAVDAKSDVKFKALPKFPAAQRDIAIIVDDEAGAGDILDAIIAAGGKKLESAEIFDVYKGAQLGLNKKSLAYKLVFRAADRTLTDEETDGAVNKILKALKNNFGAELR